MTPKDKQELLDDYSSKKLTVAALCEKHKVSSKTIVQIITDSGVQSRSSKAQTTRLHKEIYQTVLSGASIEKVASDYGLSQKDVKKIVSAERKKSIVKDYKKGMSLKEIAERHQVSQSYIYQVIKLVGVSVKSQRNKTDNLSVEVLTAEEIHGIICDYLDFDITQRELCKKHKISVSTLYNVLKKYNVPLRSVQKSKKELAIIKAYQLHRTIPEICKTYKISRATIYRIIKGADIT